MNEFIMSNVKILFKTERNAKYFESLFKGRL